MYRKGVFLRNISEVMRISSEEMAINVQKRGISSEYFRSYATKERKVKYIIYISSSTVRACARTRERIFKKRKSLQKENFLQA